MEEGDKILGGQQVNPISANPTPTPGPQPAGFATPQNVQIAQAVQPTRPLQPTIPHQFTQNQQPPSRPTYPIMDDIILSSTPSKKPNRKKIIIAVLLTIFLLTAISGVVAFLLFSQKSSSGNEFAEYMAYLMSDSADANIDILTFNSRRPYAIDEYLQSPTTEESKNYFSNLTSYWQAYVNKNNNSDAEAEYITSISDNLEVLKLYVDKYIIPEEQILEQYLAGGENAVSQYFVDYFSSYSDESEAKSMYLLFQNYYLSDAISLIRSYMEAGCITDGNIVAECLAENQLNSFYEDGYISYDIESINECVEDSKNYVKEYSEKILEVVYEE